MTPVPRPIPAMGLGTWPLLGEDARRIIAEALSLGYRHIDTAQMYRNERVTGLAIADSGVPRDAITITTKIHQDRFADGTVLDSARASLDALQIDRADLMLVHWPPRGMTTEAVMDQMQALVAAGLTAAVGLSNFNRPQMRAACAHGPVATNQVEFHALIDQSALLAQAAALGVPLTAYMPIARGRVLAAGPVVSIADRLGATPAQVAIAWVLAKGVRVICNSARRANLIANLAATALTLPEADIAALDRLAQSENTRFSSRADWEPIWDAP